MKTKVKINGLIHIRIEDKKGLVSYTYNGLLHREDDGAAVISAYKDFYWYKNGKRHRENGPAVEYSNGGKHWYINNLLHREDGPASEREDGTKQWYKNGKRHREDGPACEFSNGDKEWFMNGVRHRIDGPAVVYQRIGNNLQTIYWYLNGELYTKKQFDTALEVVEWRKSNGIQDF